MKENFIEIVFILDRSGSMGGLETDTIGGFNSMIEKQKNESGETIVSTILFDDQFEILHNRTNINSIKPLTTKEYFVRGSTALLDAIGKAITQTSQIHSNLPYKDVPEEILFIITTDGYENASREYSSQRVKRLIESKKEKDKWQFIFLGANIDAIETARSFGINDNMSANYHSDSRGTQVNFEAINSAICSLRNNKKIRADWKKNIDEDYENRK